jgi:iron(III) transport system ATP-binding protein
MSYLQASGLHKSYGGQSILRGADLDVPEGTIVALLGSSGSGKTTLLRLIAGLDRPDAGEIVIGGRLVAGEGTNIPPEQRHIGYVPQEGALFPHLSVADNVAFGLPSAERKGPRLAQVLALTGLSGLEARYPHQLSGGQQQRTALARALAPRPSIVLLDEPFNALDLDLRRAVCADVVAALREAHATAILVTHDPVEAFSGADLVAAIRDGVIAQYGDPTTLYRTPVDPDVARLTGPAVFLDGIIASGVARTLLGDVPMYRGCAILDGAVNVMLRPEQFAIARSGEGTPGAVVQSSFYGDHNQVTVKAGELMLPVRVIDDSYANGESVFVTVRGRCIAYPQA